MRTINEQIQRLRDVLVTCYNAIKRKGGTIPEEGLRNMTNLPAAVLSIPQVHSVLTDLEVTANGEYLPQEGVDGFSKVVANVVPTKRVVLPSIKVTNNLIVDGYWAGELVDTITLTNMKDMFRNCSSLQSLDVSNWDVSNVIDFIYMFDSCTSLQSLDVSNWNVGNATGMGNMFYGCSSLQSLDVSNWNVGNVTSIYNMFYGCSSLKELDVRNWDTRNLKKIYNTFSSCISLQMLDVSKWDASKVETITIPFGGCTSLKSIIGNKSIDDVLENNIGALNGLKISVNPFPGTPNIDHASLRALINGLADVTDQPAESRPTLTLGTTLLAKLTDEDIAILTNKGWNLA